MAKDNRIFVGELPDCDICRAEGSDIASACYDAKTKAGPWAYMCPMHFQEHGIGLGLGLGQRLELLPPKPMTVA